MQHSDSYSFPQKNNKENNVAFFCLTSKTLCHFFQYYFYFYNLMQFCLLLKLKINFFPPSNSSISCSRALDGLVTCCLVQYKSKTFDFSLSTPYRATWLYKFMPCTHLKTLTSCIFSFCQLSFSIYLPFHLRERDIYIYIYFFFFKTKNCY